MLVQHEEVKRAIRALSFVTKLSPDIRRTCRRTCRSQSADVC
jgi:hypothetical protein